MCPYNQCLNAVMICPRTTVMIFLTPTGRVFLTPTVMIFLTPIGMIFPTPTGRIFDNTHYNGLYKISLTSSCFTRPLNIFNMMRDK